MIRGYLSGSKAIARVFLRGRKEDQRERENERGKMREGEKE